MSFHVGSILTKMNGTRATNFGHSNVRSKSAEVSHMEMFVSKCFDWDFMDFHFPETVTTKFRLMIDDKLH